MGMRVLLCANGVTVIFRLPYLLLPCLLLHLLADLSVLLLRLGFVRLGIKLLFELAHQARFGFVTLLVQDFGNLGVFLADALARFFRLGIGMGCVVHVHFVGHQLTQFANVSPFQAAHRVGGWREFRFFRLFGFCRDVGGG